MTPLSGQLRCRCASQATASQAERCNSATVLGACAGAGTAACSSLIMQLVIGTLPVASTLVVTESVRARQVCLLLEFLLLRCLPP